MYSIKMSILNLDENTKKEFDQATHNYINQLTSVPDLQIKVPKQKVGGTRGDLSLFADIVITAISTGAFMAIYTLAKDLFTLYENAEVQLVFEDGSSITLKHLTQKEAETKIKEHLERQRSRPNN